MKHAPNEAYTFIAGKFRHAFVSGLQGCVSVTELTIGEPFASLREKLTDRAKVAGL